MSLLLAPALPATQPPLCLGVSGLGWRVVVSVSFKLRDSVGNFQEDSSRGGYKLTSPATTSL